MTELPETPWEKFLFALLALGAAQLVIAMVLIVYDVLARNLGGSPFAHTVALTEYALLYLTFMGAPWLVRRNGHVRVQLLANVLPMGGRVTLVRLAAAACVVLCLLLAWYSAGVALESWERGDVEVRSFDMPRWAMFAVMPFSFILLAIEFAIKGLRASEGDSEILAGLD